MQRISDGEGFCDFTKEFEKRTANLVPSGIYTFVDTIPTASSGNIYADAEKKACLNWPRTAVA